MTTEPMLDRRLRELMAELAAPGDQSTAIDNVISVTRALRPEPRWRALLKERPMRTNSIVIAGSPPLRFGLIFAVIARGIPGLSFMPGYSMGTPARMGPGFFPFYLGVILFVLGVIIAVGGVRGAATKDSKVDKFHWRPILFVLISVVIFGLLLKIVGMLLSGIILVVGASLGSHEFKLKEVLPLGIFLVIFCALVFVVGLKLPIPLCPDIESLQSYGVCRA